MRAGLISSHPYDAALLDALATVVPADQRAWVILDALRAANMGALPTDMDELAIFVLGPVKAAVEARFGASAFDPAIVHLAPILSRASAHVRKRTGYTTPVQGTKAIPAGDESDEITPSRSSWKPKGMLRTWVLLATADNGAAVDIERRIGALARVRRVTTPQEIVASLSTAQREQCAAVLVVDGRLPTLDARGLGTLAHALPSGVSVVAWGTDDRYVEALATIEAGGLRCIRCGPSSSSVNLSAVLRALL